MTNKAVVSYSGTDTQDPLGILADVRSDYHILTEGRFPIQSGNETVQNCRIKVQEGRVFS